MADYELVRFSDVPDSGEGFAGTKEYELRFLRNAMELENLGVSFVRFAAGYRPAWGHRHKRQEEVYVLVSGRAQAKLDGEIVELEPWTALRVPRQTMRAFRALGDEDAVFIAAGAPYTGPGDGETDMEFWPD